jgi:hypothetical protein
MEYSQNFLSWKLDCALTAYEAMEHFWCPSGEGVDELKVDALTWNYYLVKHSRKKNVADEDQLQFIGLGSLFPDRTGNFQEYFQPIFNP